MYLNCSKQIKSKQPTVYEKPYDKIITQSVILKLISVYKDYDHLRNQWSRKTECSWHQTLEGGIRRRSDLSFTLY